MTAHIMGMPDRTPGIPANETPMERIIRCGSIAELIAEAIKLERKNALLESDNALNRGMFADIERDLRNMHDEEATSIADSIREVLEGKR